MIPARSTPARLTAALILVFAAFLAVGLGTAYVVMQRTLTADIASRAEQILAELRGIPQSAARHQRAVEIAASANPATLVIAADIDGRSIGPQALMALPDGVVDGDGAGLHDDAPHGYLVRSADLDPGRVTVLVTRESLGELNETFMAILGFSFLPALLLTSAIGMVAVRRTSARVEAIRSTLHALTGGALGARVGAPHPDTDLGDISRDLDRMAAAQEASTEALRQIGSDIAHDLKTPIQRVAVRLERLADADLPAAARDELEAVQGETSQIIATFQSLLQIAQLEGGQGRETFAPVDLAQLVRDMAEIYEPAIEEAGGTLTCRITAAAPVTGDRHLLSRLIANLVENALRHAAGGPIHLSLDGTTLVVSDRGPGIPEARREDVLRRLVRLEASRSTPGSGLGLAMVKAIAELHGARLELGDAAPGLSVTVVFPARGAKIEEN